MTEQLSRSIKEHGTAAHLGLRGHRLERLAKLYINGVRTDPEISLFVKTEIQELPRPIAKDLLGPNKEGLYIYTQVTESVIKRLLTLPNDAPLILTDERDPFCEGCPFAHHCDWPQTKQRDREEIDIFWGEITRTPHLQDQFRRPEHGNNSEWDGPIHTTAGALKKACTQFTYLHEKRRNKKLSRQAELANDQA